VNTAVLGLVLNATVARQVDKQKIMQNTILTKQLNHIIKKDGITKNRVKNLHESIIKNRYLMLQLILTQGKGMTVDEIKASHKQESHAPMNFHYMAEQQKMLTIANNIFLTNSASVYNASAHSKT
jgi:hypothetical protein